jgi:hypothetical protein
MSSSTPRKRIVSGCRHSGVPEGLRAAEQVPVEGDRPFGIGGVQVRHPDRTVIVSPSSGCRLGGDVPGEGVQRFAALPVEDPAHPLGLRAVAFEMPVGEVDAGYVRTLRRERDLDLLAAARV